MSNQFSISCSCGDVKGIATGRSRSDGNRVKCYCDDCQAFAHYLERADDVLDTHGGTDVFQMSPARLQFYSGVERLACVRLKPKGLLRWYAGCCKSPIGNTLPTRQIPFVGLINDCVERDADDRSLDDVLGPLGKGVFGRYAKGDRTNIDAYDGLALAMILNFLGRALRFRMRGDHKHSPFFNEATGQPIVTPQVLSEKVLSEIERLRDGRS